MGLPRETAKDRLYLTHEQVRELAAACADPPASVTKRRAERGHVSADYELVVLFLAYTGVRFGEVAALRVRRLDPLKRRVEIAEAVTSVNGALVWGTSPTHSTALLVPPPRDETRYWRCTAAGVSTINDDQLTMHSVRVGTGANRSVETSRARR